MRKIRNILEFNQEQFAVWLGISITTLRRWESGKTKPSFTVGQIRKLLKALKPYGLGLENLPDDLSPGNPLILGRNWTE